MAVRVKRENRGEVDGGLRSREWSTRVIDEVGRGGGEL